LDAESCLDVAKNQLAAECGTLQHIQHPKRVSECRQTREQPGRRSRYVGRIDTQGREIGSQAGAVVGRGEREAVFPPLVIWTYCSLRPHQLRLNIQQRQKIVVPIAVVVRSHVFAVRPGDAVSSFVYIRAPIAHRLHPIDDKGPGSQRREEVLIEML
jgi:hypothetical protein